MGCIFSFLSVPDRSLCMQMYVCFSPTYDSIQYIQVILRLTTLKHSLSYTSIAMVPHNSDLHTYIILICVCLANSINYMSSFNPMAFQNITYIMNTILHILQDLHARFPPTTIHNPIIRNPIPTPNHPPNDERSLSPSRSSSGSRSLSSNDSFDPQNSHSTSTSTKTSSRYVWWCFYLNMTFDLLTYILCSYDRMDSSRKRSGASGGTTIDCQGLLCSILDVLLLI